MEDPKDRPDTQPPKREHSDKNPGPAPSKQQDSEPDENDESSRRERG